MGSSLEKTTAEEATGSQTKDEKLDDKGYDYLSLWMSGLFGLVFFIGFTYAVLKYVLINMNQANTKNFLVLIILVFFAVVFGKVAYTAWFHPEKYRK